MFWNKFKLAYRNSIKNKYISLVNILGLSIGITCTLILVSWVSQELSSDSFIENKESIYRLNFMVVLNEEPVLTCTSPQGMGPEALNVLPEVTNFTRIRKLERSPFKIGENSFYIDNGYSADSTFFSVFSFESKIGDLSASLNRKDLVVIDEKLAIRCFGNNNPIGEIINIRNHNYTVSAVVKNVPENSHLQFQYLIPTLNLSESWINNKWGSDNCTQYLVLNNEINKTEFENELTQILYNNNDTWKGYGVKMGIQPLSDIYFSKGFKFEIAKKGNIKNVYILVSVAFMILLIAGINFINIFISTSLKRTKSIGVKMVSGASKTLIFKEFSMEVMIFILAAFIVSFGLVKLTLPIFNNLLDASLDIKIFSLHFLAISIPTLIVTMLLSGFFPGYFITRFNPATILKAGYSGLSGNKNTFQRSLVVLQFVIAILLITSVIVIQKQVNFINSKQLGFNKENIVYISTTGEFSQKQNIARLRAELLRSPNISNISTRSCLSTKRENSGFIHTMENPDYQIHGERASISKGYFDLMKIKFIEGEQNFDYSNDRIESCIINEIAAKQLKLTPPYIGQDIFDVNEDKLLTIKGVIENINTKSLYNKFDPCLYTKPQGYYEMGIILFKLTGDYNVAINEIKDYCMTNNSEIPFEYYFLDHAYDNLYKNETRMQKMLNWFCCISIFLTCLGLLAMVYFVTQNRTKEIGVRKVNGATVIEMLAMLNTDFLKWVVVAFLIACPIAFYLMNKWLQSFAYKTTISWWVFLLAFISTLIIALVTVSWQTIRAARRNPVEALRYE